MVSGKLCRLALALTVVALALAAPAVARAPETKLTLTPNVAGKGSTLSVESKGQSEQIGDRMVRSAILSVQRGFKVDPRSRAARCNAQQAERFSCPEASRIGSGRAVVNASGLIVPGGSQDFTAAIDLFLAPPVRRGDIAGVVASVSEPTTGQRGTATGRLVKVPTGPYGIELRFDRFPSAEPPPGVTIKLKELTLRAGAKRAVKRRGKRFTFNLITNPAKCRGTFKGRVDIGFTDGSSLSTNIAAPCRNPPR